MDLSDFVVFADESGDHGLVSIDPTYPVFVLVFCILRKEDYANSVVPAVTSFKLRWFGHDRVTLHSHDIRKSKPPFDFLLNATSRGAFLDQLSGLVGAAPMTVVASVIDKRKLVARHADRLNPYQLAAKFCVERAFYEIQEKGGGTSTTHVVFESRGKNEDASLRSEFGRICAGSNYSGLRMPFEPVFAPKATISAGLELADLVAHPIGRHSIDPAQANQAFDVVRPKLRTRGGTFQGAGLKIYP